jgi:hypothetical protein
MIASQFATFADFLDSDIGGKVMRTFSDGYAADLSKRNRDSAGRPSTFKSMSTVNGLVSDPFNPHCRSAFSLLDIYAAIENDGIGLAGKGGGHAKTVASHVTDWWNANGYAYLVPARTVPQSKSKAGKRLSVNLSMDDMFKVPATVA